MSRRQALSLPLLGQAALSLTVPAMLTVSDAEAQTAGMTRRETRAQVAKSGVRRGAAVARRHSKSGCSAPRQMPGVQRTFMYSVLA
jgi:hypothetical protein